MKFWNCLQNLGNEKTNGSSYFVLHYLKMKPNKKIGYLSREICKEPNKFTPYT